MDKSKFLEEINCYTAKLSHYCRDAVTCDNIFDKSDLYVREKDYIDKILAEAFSNTTEQGDLLEALVKTLFQRINLVHSIIVTNKDTSLGQIDVQLIPIDSVLYDVWGMVTEKPLGIIGECKNYSKKKEAVGRPEIEKICWRSCKGGCLSFFISHRYTQDAIEEIAYFNSNKTSLCCKHQGAFIVPLTLTMLEVIIQNKINFCYLIRWAIATSRMMSIANYL